MSGRPRPGEVAAADRDITYPEPARPRGYRPAHRSRTIVYLGQPQPTPSDFADLDVRTYAELYLVPEETR